MAAITTYLNYDEIGFKVVGTPESIERDTLENGQTVFYHDENCINEIYQWNESARKWEPVDEAMFQILLPDAKEAIEQQAIADKEAAEEYEPDFFMF
jgi:hypothetical protein